MRRRRRCPLPIFTSGFFIRAANSLLGDLLLSLQGENFVFGLGKWHEIKGCYWEMLWAALGRTKNILEVSVDCNFFYWRVANFHKICLWSCRFLFSVLKGRTKSLGSIRNLGAFAKGKQVGGSSTVFPPSAWQGAPLEARASCRVALILSASISGRLNVSFYFCCEEQAIGLVFSWMSKLKECRPRDM